MMIAIDWGSSHFRALLLDERGNVLQRSESDQGIFSDHFQSNRKAETFATIVEKHCHPWIKEFGPMPYYLGGMVGSRSGWVETDYVDSQHWLSALSSQLVECSLANGHIIPGVATRKDDGNWDVMRGEEIQILGALQILDIGNRALTICLPGTHSKWADISTRSNSHELDDARVDKARIDKTRDEEKWSDGKIEKFSTFMTGELFQWAQQKSSLAPLMKPPQNNNLEAAAINRDAFVEGVNASASKQPLSQSLFSIRANHLMATTPHKDPSDYLSGLLIGEEVRAALAANDHQRQLVIIGNPKLADRYQLALKTLNREAHYIDGEQAFCQGVSVIHALAKHPLHPENPRANA
ncbi:MAG: 2-dehydro-3-deoxygalactonokinase [Cellvibrionaceae bacterium]